MFFILIPNLHLTKPIVRWPVDENSFSPVHSYFNSPETPDILFDELELEEEYASNDRTISLLKAKERTAKLAFNRDKELLSLYDTQHKSCEAQSKASALTIGGHGRVEGSTLDRTISRLESKIEEISAEFFKKNLILYDIHQELDLWENRQMLIVASIPKYLEFLVQKMFIFGYQFNRTILQQKRYTKADWFQPDLTPETASVLLEDKRPGTFVIRPSSIKSTNTSYESYVLMVRSIVKSPETDRNKVVTLKYQIYVSEANNMKNSDWLSTFKSDYEYMKSDGSEKIARSNKEDSIPNLITNNRSCGFSTENIEEFPSLLQFVVYYSVKLLPQNDKNCFHSYLLYPLQAKGREKIDLISNLDDDIER